MSLRQSNKDWGWLPENDLNSSDEISIHGIGVLAIHLHHLIIEKPIIFIKETNHQAISIDTFRICINAYVLSRYSKTVRIYSNENLARFDQTMQMLLRIYDKRHDKRHIIHVILYGYLNKEKRYVLIADQVLDCIQLVSTRHISEAIVFQGLNNILGKAVLLLELVFVYGRHGYNFSSQLIFQNDIHLADTIKTQTLFPRIPIDDNNDDHAKIIDTPIYLKLSFDELVQYVTHPNSNENNIRIVKALVTSPKYSSMNAIMDMYSSKKQRLHILFDFLTEGPFLPEHNLIEPTASHLFPWGITYWKRALSGVPLHGSVIDMADTRNMESDIIHLQNTSPILRQIFQQIEHIKYNFIQDLIRCVINFIYYQKNG